MLDITILKVVHEGVQNAKRLAPYIAKCDLFCPESAAGTESLSKAKEQEWSGILRTHSRDDLAKIAAMNPRAHEGDVLYSHAVDRYLLNKQVPILCLERFSHEESRRLTELFESSDQLIVEGLSPEQSVDTLYEGLKLQADIFKVRDQHIAGHIDALELLIREAHPHLAEKDIRICIEIGGYHIPERYTTRSVHELSVVPAPNEFRRLFKKTYFRIVDGASFDDVKNDLEKVKSLQ